MTAKARRPDNAYYLLVALAVALTLITVGAILIYIGFWPQLAMSNFWKRHADLAAEHGFDEFESESPTIYLNNNRTALNDKMKTASQSSSPSLDHSYNSASDGNGNVPHPHLHSFTVLRVLGPILGVAGCVLLLAILVIGAQINWEAIPETSANFVKLRSELSLNILGGSGGSSGAGVSGSSNAKYELMVPIELEERSETRNGNEPSVGGTSKSKADCSSSGGGSSLEYLNDYNSNKIHIVEIM